MAELEPFKISCARLGILTRIPCTGSEKPGTLAAFLKETLARRASVLFCSFRRVRYSGRVAGTKERPFRSLCTGKDRVLPTGQHRTSVAKHSEDDKPGFIV